MLLWKLNYWAGLEHFEISIFVTQPNPKAALIKSSKAEARAWKFIAVRCQSRQTHSKASARPGKTQKPSNADSLGVFIEHQRQSNAPLRSECTLRLITIFFLLQPPTQRRREKKHDFYSERACFGCAVTAAIEQVERFGNWQWQSVRIGPNLMFNATQPKLFHSPPVFLFFATCWLLDSNSRFLAIESL